MQQEMASETRQTGPLFTKLPTELRLLVLEYALIEPDMVRFFTDKGAPEPVGDNSFVTRNNIPGLLCTSRVIRSEGLPLYYSCNTFLLGQNSSWLYPFPIYWPAQRLDMIRPHWHLFTRVAMEAQPPECDRTAYPSLFTYIEFDKSTGSLEVYTDAKPKQPRPLTAEGAFTSDVCVCAQRSQARARLTRGAGNPGEVMIRAVQDFAQLKRTHVHRVRGRCEDCGKGMLQLRELSMWDRIAAGKD